MTNKCNTQVQQTYWALYYRILMLPWARASYNQTCSDTKLVAPRLRETETPRIPAQRSRRSLLEYDTAYHRTNQLFITSYMDTRGLHRHDDTTPATVAPCKQQNNTKQRNNSNSETTTMVVNSTLQGLWLERLS